MSRFLCAVAISLCTVTGAWAQASPEKHLFVNGTIEADGTAITLKWVDAKPPRVGNVMVKRRFLGDSGASSWKVIAPELGPVLHFTDDTIKPGFAYEYQVLRSARDIVDVGYWAAGAEVPATERRGKVLLVIDDKVAEVIAPRIDRFARDLTGDGWQVVRHTARRGHRENAVINLNRALELKGWIKDQYDRDPFSHHSLILVGHLPLVKSGRAAPDGHDAVPHATDLFYADMDEGWPVDDKGLLRTNRVPSDAIELEVGRIDFVNLSGGDRAKEIALLRAYLDKNHHWRHGILGDLRHAYAQNGNLIVERNGLRNIVGRRYVVEGGHHDTGEEKPWLMGSDFGDWEGKAYARKYENKAVFVINFGSGKQKIESNSNALTASLAQPWYTIAAGWGGRPAWRLHHMALGRSIGESHRRTVNNGVASLPYRETMDYWPTGNYLWRNPVWVNLLGDPTARPFVLSPPEQLRVERAGGSATVSWQPSADADTVGYKIYRSDEARKDFIPLTREPLVDTTRFTDADAPANATYMVRAYGLKQVHSGSFYTYSQGVFATADSSALKAEALTASGPAGDAIAVPFPAAPGKIFALIEGPEVGELSQTDGTWVYTSPAGFNGDVALRYSVSDAFSTDIGEITISVEG